MITSFEQVILGFLDSLGAVSIKETERETDLSVPIRYGRKSKHNTTETDMETYPCIIILDYAPKHNPDYSRVPHRRIDGYHNLDLSSNQYTKAYAYKEPVNFLWRFDVSIFSNDPLEFLRIQESLLAIFEDKGSIHVNKQTFEQGSVSDPVYYTMQIVDVDRTDGIRQGTFQFTLKPFISLEDGVLMEDLVSQATLVFNDENFILNL